MRVGVTGGTGYLGPAVVEEMLREGHEVVALEHRQKVPVGAHPRLTRVQGDVRDVTSLRGAFAGCDAVAHLVGIIREDRKKGKTFQRVHVEGTRNVVEAARAEGVRRFLLMSANGVESGLDTPYFRTKLEMERLVKDAGFDATIFRPSYIASAEEGGFDRQFADIVDTFPVLPSFAGGKFLIQPIARRNVAQAFARALSTPASVGKTYVLAGPERMTWNDYLRRLARVRGRKRVLAYAPGGVMVLTARALGPLFPADADALRMLMIGNVGDNAEAVQDLGLELERWEDAVSGLRR
ncbi:MAG TPA: complex I NDUFA9 subunit family protein [Candidatus Thermoplasmatota archaeon]|nr:complex I NDUFA9 subunit family protein [Candidatus Thermoplasmatota archaeon]